MDNHIEDAKATDISKPKDSSFHSKQTANNKRTNAPTSVIAVIACVLATLAIVFSFYTLKSNKKIQNELDTQSYNMKIKLQDFKNNQLDSQKLLNENERSLKQQQTDLENKLSQFANEIHKLVNQPQNSDQNFTLLKSRYYLELAQINSYWSDDNKTSIGLLQHADALLKDNTNPKIYEVRKAIAKEITQIQAIPKVDVTGILSQLDAAQISVSTLNVRSVIEEQEIKNPSQTSSQSEDQSTWGSRIHNSVIKLEKYIVIRRTNEDIKPLLSPIFESMLRESIRLSLQEAQWAVLNKNQEVYQLSLKQALMNILRMFNARSPNTVELVKQLSNLQQVKLTQEKPAIGLALPILNKVINQIELPANPQDNVKGVTEQ